MIVCIGSINVDLIFATARRPDEHENYRAKSYMCERRLCSKHRRGAFGHLAAAKAPGKRKAQAAQFAANAVAGQLDAWKVDTG
jgi:hypothetical protein